MPKRAYSGISKSHTAAVKRRKTMGEGKASTIGRVSAPTPIYKATRALQAFPQQRRSVCKYTQTFTLDPGAGGTQKQYFRINSAFDPDFTSGGHQPYGYDQLMAIYSRYTVVSSKIKASYVPTAPGTTESWLCGLIIADSNTLPTQADDLMEMPYSKWRHLERGNGPVVLTNQMDMARFFGVKDVMDVTDLSGAQASNPANVGYAAAWVGIGNASVVDPEPIAVTVEIEYDVIFHEPKPVINS